MCIVIHSAAGYEKPGRAAEKREGAPERGEEAAEKEGGATEKGEGATEKGEGAEGGLAAEELAADGTSYKETQKRYVKVTHIRAPRKPCYTWVSGPWVRDFIL